MSTTDKGIVCPHCGARLANDEAYAYHISHDPPRGCGVVSVAFGSAWPSLGDVDDLAIGEPSRKRAAPGQRVCVQCGQPPAASNKSLCIDHQREYDRAYYAANRAKRRAQFDASRSGSRQ